MHQLPEQEKLARAAENYCKGLIKTEMSHFGKRVIEAWSQRWRAAMRLERAKRVKRVQKER